MVKTTIIFICMLLFVISSVFPQKVYYAKIEGEIDLGLAPYVKRVIQEAQDNSAKAIIFRINTFGGRVDAATQIKDAILNSKVMTIAFIDKRAISAGALIALSCQKIVMVPGASIGATTVVDQEGKKQAEKYQSYMRSEMRATAEKNGRRTDIAQAMVDETIVVSDLQDDSTKLVTLTSEEALKYKIADAIFASIDEVKQYFKLENAAETNIDSNWAEKIVRFISNPIVSSLLIMIGLIGIFTEIKTPGFGFAGVAGFVALSLFFGSSYILELATIWEIIIFIIGVILLLVEIFVIPGFGVVGFLGVIFMIGGLFFGLLSDLSIATTTSISIAIIQLAGTFVATGVVVFLIWRLLPKSETFNKLILDTSLNSKFRFTVNAGSEIQVGDTGFAITDLRPSGTVLINDKRIDVITVGNFIDMGGEIIVRKIEGLKVVVDKK